MGPCTASSCCCQARNLPWAPVPTPHAAARPRNLSWAPVPPPHSCCQVQSGSWVPCTGPPIGLLSSIATLCHVPLSGLLTQLVVFHFCHRVLYGLPLLLSLHRHTVLHTLVLARDCPRMSEVCGDLRSITALILCMSY
ncbi:unnamed protein product [Staurois parvus]|uniref:Uncharacterized protein n=1 Tax=Staurois parvus TaxID=386267 RepID=A0ABN9D135_9NEOB|nr:unnamed protein product [Staurois parvus]